MGKAMLTIFDSAARREFRLVPSSCLVAIFDGLQHSQSRNNSLAASDVSCKRRCMGNVAARSLLISATTFAAHA